MTRNEFLARLLLTAVLTPVIHYGAAVFDVTIVWVAAAVIAVVLVFVGELLILGLTGDA